MKARDGGGECVRLGNLSKGGGGSKGFSKHLGVLGGTKRRRMDTSAKRKGDYGNRSEIIHKRGDTTELEGG